MSLSLTCACGTRFEVEETFAGQEVACPECQRPLKAPLAHRTPRRTSGFALASVILALAGSFTVIGTLVAVVLGLAGLVSVARHRDRLAGTGFALFGIVWGLAFTALALFAYSSGELFGVNTWMREAVLAGQVSYDGPLEVVQRDGGFAITRPSEKWGVAVVSPEPIDWPDDPDRGVDITLLHIPHNASVDVTYETFGNRPLEQIQEQVLGWFGTGVEARRQDQLLGFTQGKLRHSRRLPPQGDGEAWEMLLDVRFAGEGRTYLVRLIKHKADTYILRGWAPKRRFGQVETEIRQTLDSFRLLNEPAR